MRAARSRRRAVVAVALGLLALAPAAAGSELKRCDDDHRDRTRCAQVVVPLDRSGAVPGVVRLRVRLLPADDDVALTETVLVLAGGPGEAGVPALEWLQLWFRDALRSRRLLAFDQRGTGGSGRLRCPGLDDLDEQTAGAVVDAIVTACAVALGPARTHYSTADSVADIEAVRAALGIEKLILFGTSYGTKVALDYAAAHPDRVSRLVLDSPVPPDGVDPFARTTIGSVPRVLRSLCARRSCRFTADPAADVAALAQRLAEAPLEGRIFDGRGHPRTARLGLRGLLRILLAGDIDPFERASVPAAVRSALDGDPEPLLRLAARDPVGLDPGTDSEALFLATMCADGNLPWVPGTPIAARDAAIDAALARIPAVQLAPFGPAVVRATSIAELCRAWPEAPLVQPRPPLTQVPTLILSGNEDLRTPRADALMLGRRIEGAQVVTVPHTGHAALVWDPSDCAREAVAAFFAGRNVRPCRSRRRFSPLAPTRPAPLRLRELSRLEGLPPRVGRTLAAVGHTIAALGTETFIAEVLGGDGGQVLRVGGLRGGSVTQTERLVILRRYAYVPGVALSGRFPEDADDPATLRIRGRAAARGHLRIGDPWTVGRLGGHRIRVRTERLFVDTPFADFARAAADRDGGPPGPLRRLLAVR
jgi:pimeloyl-ACP methyl ester carboxylesterase